MALRVSSPLRASLALALASASAACSEPSAPIETSRARAALGADGLVAYWALDEGGGLSASDSSGRGHTGVLVNGARFTSAGRVGGGLELDGQNDRVDVAAKADLDVWDTMTLAAWVYPTAGGGWRTVLMREGARNLQYALYASDAAGGAASYVHVGADVGVVAPTTLALNAWSHLATTYDGATLRLYVNGALAATRAESRPLFGSTRPLRLGGNTLYREPFRGVLDEVRVYDRPLSAAEVAELAAMGGGCVPGGCDDGDACTTDTCDAEGACRHVATVCTALDQCHVAGTCDPTTGACSNPAAADGTPCDDGDACSRVDSCAAGTCLGADPVTCAALDQCHVAGTCDPTTGACSNPAAADGTACDDGDACSRVDSCAAGACLGANPVVCAALNQCHVAGTCDPATGACSNPAAADGTACDDGDACSRVDSCAAGTCLGADPVVCAALDQCHVAGTCDPTTGACSNPAAANGTPCDDGDACTTDTCDAEGACRHVATVCAALDQCHVAGTCDPTTGACSNPAAADGTPCDDGDACSRVDSCAAGTCLGADPVVCAALDQCHVAGTCDPTTGACSNPAAADGTACDDGDACSRVDSCAAGACLGADPVVCAALDQCHVAGTCDPTTGACSNPAAADGTACDDGDACSRVDSCAAGTCLGADPVVCAALDQCHVAGTCDPTTGACSNPAAADGTPCDDGDACSRVDSCAAGTCLGADPVTCTALDQCHVAGTCDPTTGACSNPAAADGTPCDDGDACSRVDSCAAGTCIGANAVTCAALDQCHVAGTCDPTTGACSNPAAADGTACDDGDACSRVDSCAAGTCLGADPVVCTALDQCHVAGTCDPTTGACSNPAAADGTACDDGDACSRIDSCSAGTCLGADPVVCAALDQCHVAGTCDPTTGACSNPAAADGTPCDDGDACSRVDSCAAGACLGADPVVCAALDQCHVAGTCDPTTGACSNPAAADGTPCDDGDAATLPDTCRTGICTGRRAVCGDGIVTPAAGELCDDGGESATCDSDCTPALCGDRVVNAAAGEVCDDTSSACRTDCQANTAPVADPGDDRSWTEDSWLTLDGSGSYDVDGDLSAASWRVFSAPAGATGTFDNSSLLSPRFRGTELGAYQLELRVTDSRGAFSTARVTVDLLPSTGVWMQLNAAAIGDRSLRRLVLPGTHDSGTSTLTSASPPAIDCEINNFDAICDLPVAQSFDGWARAQSLSIGEQLEAGVRYFDIRTCSEDVELGQALYACHALRGPSLSTILRQVASFISRTEKEIVILDFQTFYDVSALHLDLLSDLRGELGPWLVEAGPTFDLDDLIQVTPAELWATGKRVIAVYGDEKLQSACANDEARSAYLDFMEAGRTIRLYDSATRSTADDWVEIRILRDFDRRRIDSFEQSFSDADLVVTYHPVNGLNGKISALWSQVPAASAGPAPSITLYEGTHATQDRVCTVSFQPSTTVSLNFANGDAGEVVIVPAPLASGDHPELWDRSRLIRSEWANANRIGELASVLTAELPNTNGNLHVVQGQMTGSIADYTSASGLEEFASRSNPVLSDWMRKAWPDDDLNIVIVDYIETSDVVSLAIQLNTGLLTSTQPTVDFYEGNSVSNDLVCRVDVNPTRSVTFTGTTTEDGGLGDAACVNDEVRSMVLYDLQPGNIIRVYDSPTGSKQDDWLEIIPKRKIQDRTLSSLETSFSDSDLRVSYHRHDGLDGKVSRVEFSTSASGATIDFFEGDSATQARVCSLPVTLNSAVSFPGHADCDNDEARSMVLYDLPAGRVVRLYDAADGNLNDDWLEIVVLRAITSVTIPSFETSYETSDVRVIYHRNDGLAGKVSRVLVNTSPSPALAVLYEGTGGTQNVVCTLDISTDRDLDFGASGSPCSNDEARSMVLYGVPKNRVIKLYDSRSADESDDWVQIRTKATIGTLTISSFQTEVNTSAIEVIPVLNNGLDGSVSRFKADSYDVIANTPATLTFKEGNNGTQDTVCTLTATDSFVLDFADGGGPCGNDEARSVILTNIPAGARLRVYDSRDCDNGDDWSDLTTSALVGRYTVGSFEVGFSNLSLSMSHHHKNGLDGKVSCIRFER